MRRIYFGWPLFGHHLEFPNSNPSYKKEAAISAASSDVIKGADKLKIVTRREAASLIKDGITLGIGGFGAHSAPDELLLGIEERYAQEGHPRGITVFSGICTGNNKPDPIGHNHLAAEGLIDTLIAGHYKNSAKMDRLVSENKIAGYALPLGVVVNMLRAAASGKPGVITRVGIHTYADPRVEGCAVNERARSQGRELATVMNIDGKDYMFYRTVPIDVCIIRASYADQDGISLKREDMQENQLQMAMAAHNNGGIVIVQVEAILERGSIPTREVTINHSIVDYVVVSSPDTHRQNYAVDRYHPEYTGEIKIPVKDIPAMPLNMRKVIARRGALELKRGSVINLGIGIPSGIGSVANEEGIADAVILSLESGPLGGVPVEGLGFGCATNPENIYSIQDNFDFYDGGGLDAAFLGLAQVDEHGNVNVSRFGKSCAGPGGFINITQSTKNVCFMGGFTATKPTLDIVDGCLNIVSDGTGVKFVKKVEQITFSADYARETGQNVLYITERAVFCLSEEGIKLIEIAPGVDLERDILSHMEFRPLISSELKLMDSRLFRDEKIGIVL